MMAASIQSGLVSWWAPALAFAAGVVSFASPCVCPLLPGFVSFVSGTPVEEGRGRLLPVALFILGFALVFSAMGAFTSLVLPVFRSTLGVRVSGAVVVLFGLAMVAYAFRIRWPVLYAERRPFMDRVRPGPAGALPLGMAFAAGWTPCIGPVLAGILGLAVAQGGSVRGALLLFFFSMGLGLPFLLVGAGLRRAIGGVGFIRRNYHWFAGSSGVLMTAVGVLLVTGLWVRLLSPLLRVINRFTPPI